MSYLEKFLDLNDRAYDKNEYMHGKSPNGAFKKKSSNNPIKIRKSAGILYPAMMAMNIGIIVSGIAYPPIICIKE